MALASPSLFDSLTSLIYILVGSDFIPAPQDTIILISFLTQYAINAALAWILSMQSTT